MSIKMSEEMVRDLEQIKHSAETVQKGLLTDEKFSQMQKSSVKIVTPIYKLQEKQVKSGINVGGESYSTENSFNEDTDYKIQKSIDEIQLHVIDPRIDTNVYIPSLSGSLPALNKKNIADFPSEHGKRSLLNLNPLEQRRIKNLPHRPAIFNKTDSFEKRNEKEMTRLQNFLKEKKKNGNECYEFDTQKDDDNLDESSKQIELIKQKIADLQKASQKPKKDYSSNISYNLKSIVPINGAVKKDDNLLKVRTKISVSKHGNKPRGIMKHQLEAQQMTYAEPERRIVQAHTFKPIITETVSRIEEQKKTEEIERRVFRKERRIKSSRHRHNNQRLGGVHYDGENSLFCRRKSMDQIPVVEFPPTLPRSSQGDSYVLQRKGYSDNYAPLTKSHSFADWNDRVYYGYNVKGYKDEMIRLENEFRDSLLMKIPKRNMSEKSYRQEQIPGGYEISSKEQKENNGRRLNKNGIPVDFREAMQEYSFKKEVQR